MIEPHQEVESILMQTENILCDILLSGFQGIHAATIEEIEEIKKSYDSFGMIRGVDLVEQLLREIIRRKNSLSLDLRDLMKAYSQLMFYIETLID